MGSFLGDIPYAVRQLAKSPAFALAAVLTLALGIGVNAAMFSVIDQVLLRSMPFPNADRVVQMAVRSNSGGFAPTSMPDIRDWRARSHAFDSIGYFTEMVPTLGGNANPRLVAQIISSANLFDLLGARPTLGRAFLPQDGKLGHESVVVLTEQVWKEMYGGDPHILGRVVPINGVPHTVIGVMPGGFAFPAAAGSNAIWTPVPEDDKDLQARDSSMMSVVGRLRPGVPLEQARSEINSIHEQLIKEYPKDEDRGPILMQSYPDTVTNNVRQGIWALDGAVLAVWLIACANVAGLLLTRTNMRRREIAIRSALGAGRSRLVRQFLTESLLLSAAGGALGLLLAAGTLRLLKHYLAGAIIFGEDIHINTTVCVYLVVASCVSAVLFGMVPALHAAHVPAQEGLREGTAAAGTSKRQALWRDALVVGEIGLTLLLLIAAGLMVRTLLSLRHKDLGFAARQVVAGEIYLPSHTPLFASNEQIAKGPSLIDTFYRPLVERLKAMPGVQSAGLTTVRPLEGNWDFNTTVELSDRPKPDRASQQDAQARASSADYFQTMGIRLMQGRFFADADTPGAPPVLIVNQAFVKRFFQDGSSPLGKKVRINDTGARQWATIVGVVEDSPQKSPGQPPLPEVDFNLEQVLPSDGLYQPLASFMMNVVVRSTVDPQAVIHGTTDAVHALQSDAAVRMYPMSQVVDDAMGNQVLAARLLGLFSLAGLAIAVAGIYGLLAYSVSQRTRELGVRLALGAQRGQVMWLVLRHAVVLLVVGMAVGLVVTLASSKVVTAFLIFKLGGLDVLAGAGVAVLLAVCCLAASYLPARKAASIDPVVALRTE
jgi:predicted permease